MRKIMYITILLVSLCGFSQKAIIMKDSLSNPWGFQFDIRSNQILTQISKPIAGYKYDLETRISIRLNRVELYEGIAFDIDENIRFIPSVGIEYLFEKHEFNPRVRASLHGHYNTFSFRVNYGSDWETHGVNTRFVYNIIGNRFQFGIESIDEDIGPRIDMRINVGVNRVKLLRLYGSFVNNQMRWGVSIHFPQWFPKLQKKISNLEENINPF